MKFRPRRADLILLLSAIAGGLLFFPALSTLWPLVRMDLSVPPDELTARARQFLEERGFPLEGYESATALWTSSDLGYVERTFGRERAQEWIAKGAPLAGYWVSFKKAGEPDAFVVNLSAACGESAGNEPGDLPESIRIMGWRKEIEEDEPGASPGVDEARALARSAVVSALGVDPGVAEWQEKMGTTADRPARRDHTFAWERRLSKTPELREQLVVTVAGDTVASANSRFITPSSEVRAGTAREAPGRGLESIGIALLAVGAVGAFVIFLLRLRDGSAHLGRAGLWVGVLFLTQFSAQMLQTNALFIHWETLAPRWVSTIESIVYGNVELAWLLLVLLAFIAAGDALDREAAAGRGDSLWALGRGRFADPAVALASMRGFLAGLVCGGAMAGAVIILTGWAGARTALQPAGFFFNAINSASPALSTLLFFLNVALAEELGYRFFGGSWMLSLTRRRWIAIVVPAAVYGLTHSTLSFLPPEQPFWGRAAVMTVVGCVWGIIYFQYDALTVVLSHYTADLFIFNWPRLASGKPGVVAIAVITIAVPLVPALVAGMRFVVRRFAGGGPEECVASANP